MITLFVPPISSPNSPRFLCTIHLPPFYSCIEPSSAAGLTLKNQKQATQLDDHHRTAKRRGSLVASGLCGLSLSLPPSLFELLPSGGCRRTYRRRICSRFLPYLFSMTEQTFSSLSRTQNVVGRFTGEQGQRNLRTLLQTVAERGGGEQRINMDALAWCGRLFFF